MISPGIVASMNAIILSVGDELVLGQTVDTNSAWISQQLAAIGVRVSAHMTVGDDQNAIEQAIRESAERVPCVIISGGIGPTEDDLTRQALAKVMGVELELNETWLAKLHEFFNKLGRKMPESNKIQAMIPRGATMIDNGAGTAAGIRATLAIKPSDVIPLGRVLTKLGKVTREQVVDALVFQKSERVLIGDILVQKGYCTSEDRDLALIAQSGNDEPAGQAGTQKCEVFVMPGVPKEMKAMFTRDVLPHISARAGGAVILQRTLHTFGLGESTVAERIGSLMMRQRNPSVGTTVANGFVSLRVNARFDSKEKAQQEIDQTIKACYDALGDAIWGEDNASLQELVSQMLKTANNTVTTAESCTGGLLAKMLTDIAGSSDYFKQGWITYSNQAKYERLGVPNEIINVYGAVSEPVVAAMAKNARRLAKADFALSISGVAGPGGGSPTKPVGTVCIGFAYPKPESPKNVAESELFTRQFTFTGDREMVRDRSAKMALSILRFHLLGKPLPF
jgi:PncC family amidohydrolase